MNKFRAAAADLPKPAEPQTMADFVAADRQARMPKIQRRDELAARNLEWMKRNEQ